MKTKLIVAALACLALGACNQDIADKAKEEKKTIEQQETVTPATPSNTDTSTPGHSSIDNGNQFASAADDQTTGTTVSPSGDQGSTSSSTDSNVKNPADQSGYSTDNNSTSTTPGSATDSTNQTTPAH